MTLVGKLRRGLDQLDMQLPADDESKLIAFLELLNHWNRSFNLTAIREPGQMVAAHLLDSLIIRPWLVGSRVLDVGSGAGLPGIPLAIAEPERFFVLLDSTANRCRFLTQACLELDLKNVQVENHRVEDYLVSPDQAPSYTTITARAFSSLDKFVASAGRLLAADGRLLAMKGRLQHDEMKALPAGWQIESIENLVVPGLSADRHLLIVTRQ